MIGEVSPIMVQRSLRTAQWIAKAARDDLRGSVVEQLGDSEAVLISLSQDGTKWSRIARSGTSWPTPSRRGMPPWTVHSMGSRPGVDDPGACAYGRRTNSWAFSASGNRLDCERLVVGQGGLQSLIIGSVSAYRNSSLRCCPRPIAGHSSPQDLRQ